MKMVKSLLLGSATGLVAIAGAQAADLPVKAKPVQYVKICSLYGVGFYYIPGTDMCLKVGGWVRLQYQYNANGSTTVGYFANANINNRTTNDSDWRARGYVTLDARNQTPYGTVRAYMDVGFISDTIGGGGGIAAHTNRGFIQWAGFTFGQATSFYDFYSFPAVEYLAAHAGSEVGGGGWFVAGYTAQFGNGFSGTIAAEMRRQTQIFGQSSAPGLIIAGSISPGGIGPGGGYAGFQSPDIVANLRVDQAWGSAQIMGALHQVSTPYYGFNTVQLFDANGHPGDEWGFAIGGGLKLNAPMIGHGDYFQIQADYTQGALGYVFSPQISDFNWYARRGQNAGYGVLTDAVFGGTLQQGNATGLFLTSAWGVNGSYEHHWNPSWKTSVYGGYAEVSYGTQANAMLCSSQGGGNGTGVGTTAVATAGCNNDWNVWYVGSRTQWNVSPDFYMGVDVMYQSLQSASTFNGILPGVDQLRGATLVSDMDAVQVEFRVHKDFYP